MERAFEAEGANASPPLRCLGGCASRVWRQAPSGVALLCGGSPRSRREQRGVATDAGGWAGVCEVCCQCHWRWVSVGACAVRGPLGAHEPVVAVRRGPGHAVRCGEHQGCGGRGSFDVSRRARRCAWRRCAASCLFRGARGGGCRSPLPSLSRPCHPFVDINLYFLCATCVPDTTVLKHHRDNP